MNIKVNCRGFIGDVLFQSSVAKKLKEKYPGCYIRYVIPVIQPKMLLEQNPYIDDVEYHDDFMPVIQFDMVIDMPVIDQQYPATIQCQALAGIEDQSVEFEVYTIPNFDLQAAMLRDDIKHQAGEEVKIIAWQKNWEWKAYQCTPETLRNGIGAPHRNIEAVITELKDHFILLDVGFDRHVDTNTPIAQNAELYARTASLIKMCDYCIGSEGGITNLSCGMGTKTIITTDYIAQNYWKTGRVRKTDVPQMGPATYGEGHSHLHPCISDDELTSKILNLITTNSIEIFDWDWEKLHGDIQHN